MISLWPGAGKPYKDYSRSSYIHQMQRALLYLILAVSILFGLCVGILDKVVTAETEAPEPAEATAGAPTLCEDAIPAAAPLPYIEETGGGTEAAEAEPESTPEDTYFRTDIPLGVIEQKQLFDAAEEFDIPYTLALAVIDQETDYSNIMGDGGASYGYMQVQPRWWQGTMDALGVTDLLDPTQNFRTGCAVLAGLIEKNDGSIPDALTEYNTGMPGTSPYSASVLATVDKLGAGS